MFHTNSQLTVRFKQKVPVCLNRQILVLLLSDRCIVLQCQRLASGMTKIAEASEQLNDLNDKLAVQKVAVEEKTIACERLLQEISDGTQKAMEKKQLAVKKGKEIEDQTKIITVEKV